MRNELIYREYQILKINVMLFVSCATSHHFSLLFRVWKWVLEVHKKCNCTKIGEKKLVAHVSKYIKYFNFFFCGNIFYFGTLPLLFNATVKQIKGSYFFLLFSRYNTTITVRNPLLNVKYQKKYQQLASCMQIKNQ